MSSDTDFNRLTLHVLIRMRYPHAICERDDRLIVVYNLGTVFDLISNAGTEPTPVNIGLLRALVPEQVTLEILNV